jgi:ABC-2 type transport system permease protein
MNYLSSFLPSGVVSAIGAMSFQTHFESIQKGVLEFKDMAYFVLLIAGWVFACGIILDERKAI